MNNKAQLNIVGLAIILIVTLISVLALIFSSTFRFIVIGIGLIIASFVIVSGRGIKSDKIRVFMFVILLGAGLILLLGAGTFLQSITGISNVQEKEGDFFWIVSGVANDVDDEFIFSFRGNDYTTSDGDVLEPQRALSFFLNKKESKCEYQLETISITPDWTFFNPFPQPVSYKILKNPSRIAKVEVTASSGQSSLILGSEDQGQIRDIDGKGVINIETLGLLGAEKDCPSPTNVAIISSGRLVNRDDFENAIRDFGGLPEIPDVRDIPEFTEEFNSISTSSTKLTGEKDIGNVQYRIEVSADYFNAVVVVKQESVKPSIRSVSFPSNIQEGDDATLSVRVSTNTEGRINVKPSSDDFSISPSSDTESVDGEKIFKFNLVAKTTRNYDIDVEACSVGQFTSIINCDTETISGRITEDKPEEFCGDNVCQSSESSLDCPEDCGAVIVEDCQDDTDCSKGQTCEAGECTGKEILECSVFEKKVTTTEKDYGVGYWRAYTPFVDPIEKQVEECKIANWVSIALILILVGGLGAYAIFLTQNKGKKKGRGKKR